MQTFSQKEKKKHAKLHNTLGEAREGRKNHEPKEKRRQDSTQHIGKEERSFEKEGPNDPGRTSQREKYNLGHKGRATWGNERTECLPGKKKPADCF